MDVPLLKDFWLLQKNSCDAFKGLSILFLRLMFMDNIFPHIFLWTKAFHTKYLKFSMKFNISQIMYKEYNGQLLLGIHHLFKKKEYLI